MSESARFLLVHTATRAVGLALPCVREVVGLGEPWSVPHSDHAVRGVVPLRDRLVPVVDLGSLLGDAPLVTPEGTERMAVLLDVRGRQVALEVRGADAVVRAPLLPRQAGDEVPGLLGVSGEQVAIPVVDPAVLLARILEPEGGA